MFQPYPEDWPGACWRFMWNAHSEIAQRCPCSAHSLDAKQGQVHFFSTRDEGKISHCLWCWQMRLSSGSIPWCKWDPKTKLRSVGAFITPISLWFMNVYDTQIISYNYRFHGVYFNQHSHQELGGAHNTYGYLNLRRLTGNCSAEMTWVI